MLNFTPANNIRKLVIQRKGKEAGTQPIPDYKLDLMEHMMLCQFDGPDEFFAAIDQVIEKFAQMD